MLYEEAGLTFVQTTLKESASILVTETIVGAGGTGSLQTGAPAGPPISLGVGVRVKVGLGSTSVGVGLGSSVGVGVGVSVGVGLGVGLGVKVGVGEGVTVGHSVGVGVGEGFGPQCTPIQLISWGWVVRLTFAVELLFDR